MSEWTTILRGSPGTEGWEAPGAEHRGRSLSSQVSLYWHAAADVSADGDSFGLMAVLVARGRLVLHGILVVPDDLDAASVSRLRRWGKRHPVKTIEGLAPWRVVTRSAYFSPKATRERQPWAFVPNAYNSGAGPVVGADHGRHVGLFAEYVEPRRGRNAKSWQAWLPGWGIPRPEKRDIGKVSRHRPPLWIESRRVGWSVRFGPCEKGCGTAHPAPFLDVLTAAYALDADRSAGFVEHARNFGLTADVLPVVVTVDADGAASVTDAVRSVHALALAIDEECGRWFTTEQDRREWTRRIPLAYLHSPAGFADHLLRRLRVDPPLGRFPLSAAEHAAWWEAFHGGWCDDVAGLRGRAFGAVALDVTSAYPLTAHLVGWWNIMTADRLEHRSVLRQLRALCRRAAKDPAVVLDPAVWECFGVTLCEVVPDGELFPIAVDDPHRPDGRTETAPVTAKGRTMFYSWCDVVAAAILSGRVPRIVRAVRLVPIGRQDGLRQRIAVYPGLVLDAHSDPVLGLVRRRRDAKAQDDKVLAAELHAMVNSLVSGNLERADDVQVSVGGKWRTAEKPGPWTFIPLGTTAVAGARLLLAVLARQVRDLGGLVAYRDTDSSIIPASPDGGTLTLADGSMVRELSYAEIDGLLGAFDRLSPEPGWPVWKREPKPGEAPMRCIVFGPKRHVEYRGTDDAPELVDWTEAGQGGMWSAPAGMVGRCADGGSTWSKVGAEREVRYAAAKLADPERAARDRVPWDAAGELASPTLRRLQVTSPAVLATLPGTLGAHVGSRYVEATPSTVGTRVETVRAVTLDPGGPLADWASLGWVDRHTGEPVRVTTDAMDLRGAVLVESLGVRSGRYGAPPEGEPVSSVTVTPLSVRYAGRVSPVLDASEDGMPGPLAHFRVRYEDAHGLGPGQHKALVRLARLMPHAEFAELAKVTPRVARQIAADQLPRKSTVVRILAALRRNGGAWSVPGERVCVCGCGTALGAGKRVYVDAAHRERAKKRRARSHDPGESGAPREGEMP